MQNETAEDGRRVDGLMLVWHARFGLTGAEQRVAAQCVRGLANKEIAGRLGISTSTVRTQIAAVFRKMSLFGRGELQFEALRESFRSPPTGRSKRATT